MLNDQIKSKKTQAESERLFRAQEKVNDLIQKYVAGLETSHEGLEQHVSVLKAIFDSVNDPLIVYDPNGTILLANRAAAGVMGTNISSLPREEFLSGCKLLKTDGCTPFTPEELPFAVALRESRPVVAEGIIVGQHIPPGGLWIRASEAPVMDSDGKLLGVVALFQDITERKRLERQRNALVTLITHDLKNHLAAEDITISMLSNALREKLDSTYLELLSDVKRENQKYLDIANTLLELYRADFNEIESCRSVIEVAELLQSAVELNAQQAQIAGVKLNLKVQNGIAPLFGIPAALRQSFHNLIQNSVEVSSQGTTIEIRASSTADTVVIEVADEGSGMTEEQISDLFALSRVAAGIPTNVRSTGFGLYLSSLIIENHSGKITCTSAPGKGTTFTVVLPTAP